MILRKKILVEIFYGTIAKVLNLYTDSLSRNELKLKLY